MNTKLRRPVLIWLAALALVWVPFGGHSGWVLAASNLSGAPAPDFVLKSASGENYRLSEYRGEVVVVSFWATWCGDCRAQLSELNDWYGTYENAGLRMLAVSLDREMSDAEATAESLRLTFPVLHDAELNVGQLYGVSSMPVAVLIDRDGVVRDIVEGFRRSREEAFLERVRDLLRE